MEFSMTPQECCEYFYKTGKIPPLNLLNWVTVYTLITGTSDDCRRYGI